MDDDDLGDEDDVEEAAKEESAPARPRAGSDEDDEDEDEPDPDDVEEDLDTILKDRIAANDDEDEDDEDAPPVEASSGEPGGRVQPKRPGEFTCQSCFLVKLPSQLADPDAMLCADCV